MEKEVKEIQKDIGCDATSVWIMEDGEIIPYIFLGEKGQKLESIKLKKGEGLCGYCIEHEEEIISNDIQKDERWYKAADEYTEYETKNIICLPLIVQNECIGCIQLLNKQGGFSEDDLSRCRSAVQYIVENL